MILRLEVPFLAAGLTQATVTQWIVSVGESVGFGQTLCLLTVADRVKLAANSRADSLVRSGRRRGPATEVETDRFRVSYRVVASETAVVTKIEAEMGSVVGVGDLIALAEIPGADVAGSGDRVRQMRLVATLLDGVAMDGAEAT